MSQLIIQISTLLSHDISEKKRKIEQQPGGQPLSRPLFTTVSKKASDRPQTEAHIKKVAPSKLLSNLASVKTKGDASEAPESVPRSSGFKETPRIIREEPEQEFEHRKRDERLALVEDLEPGPYEFTSPHDDPDFERLEPHSGINMK